MKVFGKLNIWCILSVSANFGFRGSGAGKRSLRETLSPEDSPGDRGALTFAGVLIVITLPADLVTHK